MDPFKQLVPEAFDVLARQNEIVMRDGALSIREKELIAVALSISTRCEPCLRTHLRRARDAGATPEMVAEAVAVATLMGGGPAYVWSKRTLTESFDDPRKAD